MRHVLMLRGVNLGPNRRVPMAELRTLLSAAGYDDVRTYVQSGNVVLESAREPHALEIEAGRLIAERFGFEVPVVARSRDDLAAVVALDPLGDVAVEPKRYQVTFLAREPDAETVAKLTEMAAASERFAVHGRELYTWHPDGIARSKLAVGVTGKALGANATARNWATVTTLLAMASA